MSFISPGPVGIRARRAITKRHGRLRVPILSLLITLLVCAITASPNAKTNQYEPVALSERIGLEIDRDERDAYGLFPDIEGFESARIVRLSAEKYRVEFSRRDGTELKTGSRRISAEAFELSRQHVQLVETCRDVWGEAGPETNARVLYQMALRHAIERRYDLSVGALDELKRSYPVAYDSLGADTIRADATRLTERPGGLFQPGSVIDRDGFTHLMIFAGYYGLWFGIAAPIAIAGDEASAEAIAAGSIIGPGLSLVLANVLTSGKSITKADAQMISMGGWLGTWQGLGWASYADVEGETDLQAGLAGGLAGIGLAIAAAGALQPSEGYASLMNSSVWWGAWLGFVGAVMADADDPLPASLIGSDVLLLGAALGARNTGMTSKRVRLMNLGGVLGAVTGSGLGVLGHVEDDRAWAAIVGLTSLIGAGIAVHATAGEPGVRPDHAFAAPPGRGARWVLEPAVSVRRADTGSGEKTVPCLGLKVSF